MNFNGSFLLPSSQRAPELVVCAAVTKKLEVALSEQGTGGGSWLSPPGAGGADAWVAWDGEAQTLNPKASCVSWEAADGTGYLTVSLRLVVVGVGPVGARCAPRGWPAVGEVCGSCW